MTLTFDQCTPGMRVRIRWNDFGDDDSEQTGTITAKTRTKVRIEWDNGNELESKADGRAFTENRLTQETN